MANLFKKRRIRRRIKKDVKEFNEFINSPEVKDCVDSVFDLVLNPRYFVIVDFHPGDPDDGKVYGVVEVRARSRDEALCKVQYAIVEDEFSAVVKDVFRKIFISEDFDTSNGYSFYLDDLGVVEVQRVEMELNDETMKILHEDKSPRISKVILEGDDATCVMYIQE